MRHTSVLIGVLILCCGLGAACTQGRGGDALWQGVFVAEKSFGPQFRGPLTFHRMGDGWSASIQGERAEVKRTPSGDGAHWAFAIEDQGRFEGHQSPNGGAIDGHWIQAPGEVEIYPFATPVRLEPASDAAFVGEVRPFPQEVSLNISLTPDGDPRGVGAAKYQAFLRNPQRNLGVFFRIDAATVKGEEIRFVRSDGEELAVGRSVEPGQHFSLVFPRFGETFDFRRRPRHDAPGFYPRRSTEAQVKLGRPVETGDGWKTATPGAADLDEGLLRSWIQSLATFEPTGLRQPYIHGVLLARGGQLVLEEYFHGHHRDMTHDSRSAGKSLASVLLGIAIRRGDLPDLDQPVYSFFGGVEAFENPDPRKRRLTVRHLITMTSGLDCDDDDWETPGNEDRMQSQSEQTDWYRYALDLPMVREPGEAGVYCTAGIHLAGGVIRAATGKSLPRFFHEELAEPLGMGHYQMNLSASDRGYMGGGIRLRPRDFLKLGQLFLDGGVWQGRRIVSEDWARESAAGQATLYEDQDYGFAWWRRTDEIDRRTIDTFYASGNGGQLLFVIPELDTVAMIQAGNYSDGRTRNEFRDRFLRDFILPSALVKR
ncbi:MAG: serine hydrolase [Acidobacteriota bacterium]